MLNIAPRRAGSAQGTRGAVSSTGAPLAHLHTHTLAKHTRLHLSTPGVSQRPRHAQIDIDTWHRRARRASHARWSAARGCALSGPYLCHRKSPAGLCEAARVAAQARHEYGRTRLQLLRHRAARVEGVDDGALHVVCHRAAGACVGLSAERAERSGVAFGGEWCPKTRGAGAGCDAPDAPLCAAARCKRAAGSPRRVQGSAGGCTVCAGFCPPPPKADPLHHRRATRATRAGGLWWCAGGRRRAVAAAPARQARGRTSTCANFAVSIRIRRGHDTSTRGAWRLPRIPSERAMTESDWRQKGSRLLRFAFIDALCSIVSLNLEAQDVKTQEVKTSRARDTHGVMRAMGDGPMALWSRLPAEQPWRHLPACPRPPSLSQPHPA